MESRYGGQEYCHICTYDLSGKPATLNVPIVSCFFLHDHRCLNWEDSDVKLRPLCYNTECVHKDHWVVESKEIYDTRRACPATGQTCKHSPPCLIPGDLFWKKNVVLD